MSMYSFYSSGVLKEKWDDVARTYTAYNTSGVQTSTRAFTPAENTAADERVAADNVRTNAVQIQLDLNAALNTLQTIIADTNANINANAAVPLKDVCRILRKSIKNDLKQFDTAS